ncbi:putative WRKY transcription factor 19 [Phytophthora citrophthora]|uniref:WRKY transcription factor 19 n=1 Tax=Phytophthora citrophthora TaxID=4793 RepID=A0AAD9G870_9STRA|nr:putative WRKY transcription factor 19 [Phytophthora citrophthora]
MVPTAGPAELQFSSFLTQLKAPPSTEDPMTSEEQQWSSPTSITTNPTDATTSTSQPLPSFTLEQQNNNYYGNGHIPRSLATPTGYYSQQLLPPRDAQTTTTSAPWSAPTYSTGTPMLGDYLHQQPPPQPPLHPLVMQHSEPMPRSNDEDLAMDAQMLREVLQEMPTGQTPVNAQPRGQQMPGLQLLFASPMHSTDMHAVSQPAFYHNSVGMNAPADMLLTMSQTASTLGSAPVAPMFPPVATQDRSVLPSTLPLPTGSVNLPGPFDPLTAAPTGAMVPPPTLPRKKRTTATRICKVEGCTKGIRSRGLCKAHGGGRRCTTPGCTTSDQGGGHCVLHGGGRRCRIEGCKKSAQWRGVCKMHGGARRCRYGQCTKNGQVKQGYCRMHHNLLTAQRQQQEQLQAQQQQQLQQLQTVLPPVPAMAVKLETNGI